MRIRREIRGDAGNQRFERMAGAAPGGPKIEGEYFSLSLLERKSRAFRSFPEREIRGIASVGILLRFGSEGSLRDFIESEQQLLAQPRLRAVANPPHVS